MSRMFFMMTFWVKIGRTSYTLGFHPFNALVFCLKRFDLVDGDGEMIHLQLGPISFNVERVDRDPPPGTIIKEKPLADPVTSEPSRVSAA